MCLVARCAAPLVDPPARRARRAWRSRPRRLQSCARSLRPTMSSVDLYERVTHAYAENDGVKIHYTQLAEHVDPTHPIRVGLLSRLPLSGVSELFEFPQGALFDITDAQGQRIRTMGRGALKAQVELAPGLFVNVVTAHLKSKLITYPNGRRTPHDENERG